MLKFLLKEYVNTLMLYQMLEIMIIIVNVPKVIIIMILITTNKKNAKSVNKIV